MILIRLGHRQWSDTPSAVLFGDWNMFMIKFVFVPRELLGDKTDGAILGLARYWSIGTGRA